MKKIYLALAALVAFTFTACSDDKDDPVSDPSSSSTTTPSSGSTSESGVCYIAQVAEGVGISLCAESKAQKFTAADCAQLGESRGLTFQFQASCPANEALKCDFEEGVYTYFYGEMITSMGFTCEYLQSMMDMMAPAH